ncbi:hypothetical protein BV898_06557 [Hypsibius exemplaris]|uniref:Uncharacterized protein n=1 Tax=Hypsibius exemplaris TaxID=2072580 RepID=A0A1W0WW96_HYPEX|nr:hypothetical protein BV898_06557 [Hypsibius exemplaris]
MEEIRNIIFFMQESTEEILALQPRIVWERNSKRAFRRKYVDELSDIIGKWHLGWEHRLLVWTFRKFSTKLKAVNCCAYD